LVKKKIKLVILDDHQSVVDGYLYRVGKDPRIEVVATIEYGEDLAPVLDEYHVDVLLLDIQIPLSAENQNPFPVIHAVPDLLQKHPDLNILVISIFDQPVLIEALIEAGVSGFITKNDGESIRRLADILFMIGEGGIYFRQDNNNRLRFLKSGSGTELSGRQLEALSLCAAYPDASTAELAKRLGVATSTVRNLLSKAYLRLGVHTKSAAIAKAQAVGLLPK
jgi:DNA-binding NarL/FixJ family response regulator